MEDSGKHLAHVVIVPTWGRPNNAVTGGQSGGTDWPPMDPDTGQNPLIRRKTYSNRVRFRDQLPRHAFGPYLEEQGSSQNLQVVRTPPPLQAASPISGKERPEMSEKTLTDCPW